MEIYLHKIIEIPSRKFFNLQEMIKWVFCATFKKNSDWHKINNHHGVFENIGDWECVGRHHYFVK